MTEKLDAVISRFEAAFGGGTGIAKRAREW